MSLRYCIFVTVQQNLKQVCNVAGFQTTTVIHWRLVAVHHRFKGGVVVVVVVVVSLALPVSFAVETSDAARERHADCADPAGSNVDVCAPVFGKEMREK